MRESNTGGRAPKLSGRLARRLWRPEGLLALVFVLTLPLLNSHIRGDGNGYYAYLRSAVIDGDLNFEDEYARADEAFLPWVFDEAGNVRPEARAQTGRVRNHWSVGPALLWAPFFIPAHLIALALGANADGYSLPYRWLCAFGTALYSFAGLLLAYRVAARLTSPAPALLATLGVWFASSLPVYMYFLPFHVHALSAFSVSLFLWYWQRTEGGRAPAQWAAWGLMGGLAASVYNLNGVFLLIPLAEWAVMLHAAGRGRGAKTGRALASGGAFAVGVVAASLPQLICKTILYGSPLKTGYSTDWFYWTDPRLWEVGFSPEHGMFLWTPVLLLSVSGIFFYWRASRRLTLYLLLAFAAFYYTVACYENWHGQSAFGSRFFVSFTPVFIWGLAKLLHTLHARPAHVPSTTAAWAGGDGRVGGRSAAVLSPGLLAAAALLTLLIVWNGGFVFQWGTNIIPSRGPVSMSEVARNQVTVVPARVTSFLLHYVADREATIREAEREDLIEKRSYELKR